MSKKYSSAKVACQSCGADLQIEPGKTAAFITCSYCGTQNAIRSHHVQSQPKTPQSPPPATHVPPSSGPTPHVQIRLGGLSVGTGTGKRVGRIIAVAAVVPILMAVGISVFVFQGISSTQDRTRRRIEKQVERQRKDALKQLDRARNSLNFKTGSGNRLRIPSPGMAKGKREQWRPISYRPLVAEVNGDGTPDVIVVARRDPGFKEYVVRALSGKDLKELWRTGLGDGNRNFASLYAAGGMVIATHNNHLWVFGLKEGENRWKATVTDKIRRVSMRGGVVVVRSADGQVTGFDSQTGKPVTDPKPQMTPTMLSTGASATPQHQKGWSLFRRPRWRDLSFSEAHCDPQHVRFVVRHRRERNRCVGGKALAYAVRSRGTRVPHIVGMDARTRKRLWHRQLTPEGSLDTISRNPVVDVRGDLAVVGWQGRRKKPVEIMLVRMSDGKALWRTELTGTAWYDFLNGVVLTKNRIYTVQTFGIQVIDTKTGKTLATITRHP